MGNQSMRCCGRLKADDPLPDGNDLGLLRTNKVELAATTLFSVPAIGSAYHTSIVVNGEEFFFSDSGIFSDRVFSSHEGKPTELIEIGFSHRSGFQLLHCLAPYFQPGTYDLLRKNCNSFSDGALYFLLNTRLERRFTTLERIGQGNMGLVQKFTQGSYQPNRAAEKFSVASVIEAIDSVGPKELLAAALEGSTAAKVALAPGARVTIIGLKNATALNGQGAQITRYNMTNGRWEAFIPTTGEVKSFRAENLRPAGVLALEPGSRVRVHGLKSDSGQSLNGAEGVVTSYKHEASRYEVNIDGEVKAFRSDNLQAL